ncbi:hypothetical protein [Brevibacillus dissolubilis]|uniref:hypothetical protein n=1 Tax=Brevibacillus dissolubilis TaxID=1844116 RepID=UPI0011173FB2|nr:hypothetical protein [Brevibacillus dissolubilis]
MKKILGAEKSGQTPRAEERLTLVTIACPGKKWSHPSALLPCPRVVSSICAVAMPASDPIHLRCCTARQ